MGNRHLIDELCFETRFEQADSTHPPEADWPGFCRDRLLAVIDKVFSEFSPGAGTIHRLEYLEVDLGTLPESLPPVEIEARLEQALRQQLHDMFRGETNSTEVQARAVSGPMAEQELLESYLQNGVLPWNAPSTDPYELETILLRQAGQKREQIKTLLLTSEQALERTIRQLGNQALLQLLALLVPGLTDAVAKPAQNALALLGQQAEQSQDSETRYQIWKSAYQQALAQGVLESFADQVPAAAQKKPGTSPRSKPADHQRVTEVGDAAARHELSTSAARQQIPTPDKLNRNLSQDSTLAPVTLPAPHPADRATTHHQLAQSSVVTKPVPGEQGISTVALTKIPASAVRAEPEQGMTSQAQHRKKPPENSIKSAATLSTGNTASSNAAAPSSEASDTWPLAQESDPRSNHEAHRPPAKAGALALPAMAISADAGEPMSAADADGQMPHTPPPAAKAIAAAAANPGRLASEQLPTKPIPAKPRQPGKARTPDHASDGAPLAASLATDSSALPATAIPKPPRPGPQNTGRSLTKAASAETSRSNSPLPLHTAANSTPTTASQPASATSLSPGHTPVGIAALPARARPRQGATGQSSAPATPVNTSRNDAQSPPSDTSDIDSVAIGQPASRIVPAIANATSATGAEPAHRRPSSNPGILDDGIDPAGVTTDRSANSTSSTADQTLATPPVARQGLRRPEPHMPEQSLAETAQPETRSGSHASSPLNPAASSNTAPELPASATSHSTAQASAITATVTDPAIPGPSSLQPLQPLETPANTSGNSTQNPLRHETDVDTDDLPVSGTTSSAPDSAAAIPAPAIPSLAAVKQTRTEETTSSPKPGSRPSRRRAKDKALTQASAETPAKAAVAALPEATDRPHLGTDLPVADEASEQYWRSQVLARVQGEFAETIERHARQAVAPAHYYRRLLAALAADEPIDPAAIAAQSGAPGEGIPLPAPSPRPDLENVATEPAMATPVPLHPDLPDQSWIEQVLAAGSSALGLVVVPLLAEPANLARLLEIWPEALLGRVFAQLRNPEFERLRTYAEAMTSACTWISAHTRLQLKWACLAAALFPRPRHASTAEFVVAYANRLAAESPSLRESFRATLCASLSGHSEQKQVEQYLRYWLLGSTSPAQAGIALERAPGAKLPGSGITIGNAGQVLAAPYLPRLFEMLGLLEKGRFPGPAQARRACQLLQFMVDERSEAAEHELALNKLLCGLELHQPLDAGIEVSEQERTLIEGMLRGLIVNWGALGGTSVAGLREAFLQRPGVLTHKNEAWQLKVEKKTLDILMERLPWSFSIIRHAWMTQPVMVEWL